MNNSASISSIHPLFRSFDRDEHLIIVKISDNPEYISNILKSQQLNSGSKNVNHSSSTIEIINLQFLRVNYLADSKNAHSI